MCKCLDLMRGYSRRYRCVVTVLWGQQRTASDIVCRSCGAGYRVQSYPAGCPA